MPEFDHELHFFVRFVLGKKASQYFTKSSAAAFEGTIVLMPCELIFHSIFAMYAICVSAEFTNVPVGPAGLGPRLKLRLGKPGTPKPR